MWNVSITHQKTAHRNTTVMAVCAATVLLTTTGCSHLQASGGALTAAAAIVGAGAALLTSGATNATAEDSRRLTNASLEEQCLKALTTHGIWLNMACQDVDKDALYQKVVNAQQAAQAQQIAVTQNTAVTTTKATAMKRKPQPKAQVQKINYNF